MLTNTLAVGTAVEAVVAWTLAQPGNEDVRSVNALVGETNDGGLNDIRSLPVRREHVLAAIRRATAGPSRRAGSAPAPAPWPSAGRAASAPRRALLPERYGGYTLGVLVQANFGGVLTIDGVPVGRELGRHAFGSPRPRPTPHAPAAAPTAPA